MWKTMHQIERIDLDLPEIHDMYNLPNIMDYDFRAVKLITWTGGRIHLEAEKKLAEIFPNAWRSQLYGASEYGGITYTLEGNKLGSCGVPLENIEMKLKNFDGETIKVPHECGELFSRAPNEPVIYYKNPEATKNSTDSDGWYSTGDLCYYDEDGEFFVVDRLKEVIKFRTDDVPPSVIENCISKHPGVAAVAVVAKWHEVDMEQPTAFVVKKPDSNVTEEEIKELVKKNLPDRMQLRGGVVFLDALPDTNSGKICKGKLRKMTEYL